MHISASAAGEAAAHGIGIELHELAKTAGTGLLVAVDIAGAIAAIRFRQRVEILGDIARQRRGQVIAQRNPLLVIILEREYALVRPVLIGQEFAECVGELHRRRFDRLEAIALIDRADFIHHRACGIDRGRAAIFQPARQARLQLLRFFGFFCHFGSKRLRRVGISRGARRQPAFSASRPTRQARMCVKNPPCEDDARHTVQTDFPIRQEHE